MANPRHDQSRQQFNNRRDNEGRKAWRSNMNAAGEVEIPKHLVIDSNYHETLASDHGVFIFSTDTKGRDRRTYQLWGNPTAVYKAKGDIIHWVKQMRHEITRVNSAAWAKVNSLTEKERRQAERQWKQDVQREKFRQFPPLNMSFPAVGSFHWPIERYQPWEVLGEGYEALDPIRMDCSCYVVYHRERTLFEVSGKPDDVKNALQRLRTTCWQIAASHVTPVCKRYFHWPDLLTNQNGPTHILMVEYSRPSSIELYGGHKKDLGRLPHPIGWKQLDFGEAARETATSRSDLKAAVMLKLRSLRHFSGNVSLSIGLGTLLVTKSKGNLHLRDVSYKLKTYLDMVEEPSFDGNVTEAIGDLATESSALEALHRSDLIMPQDPCTNGVANVLPGYSAKFVFPDEEGWLCLAVIWQQAQSSYKNDFDMISHKWTRCQSHGPTSVLEAGMTNVVSGLTWLFEIETAQCVDESQLAKSHNDFLSSLKLDVAAARNPAMDKVFVKSSSFVHPTYIQQSVDYAYNVVSCDYTLKLNRFQNWYMERKTSRVLAPTPAVHQPRWKLELSRTQWGAMFAENNQLAIGTPARWSESVDEWFPSDDGGDGWSELMDVLCKIERVVRSGTGD